MILIASALSFFSATLFVMWILSGRDKKARRRIEEELWKKNALKASAALLRDDKLSNLAVLQSVLHPWRATAHLSSLIQQADLNMRVGTLLMMMGLLGMVGFLFAYAALGFLLAVPVGLILGALPYGYAVMQRNRRFRRFEAQFPDAVDLMARAIRAGHAFSTGIKMVADEMPDPVGKEFRRVFDEQNVGLPLRSALLSLMDRVGLVDLKLFVVAVMVQRQTGGNLAEILDKIANTIRERFRILRQLRVHTAQAKLTGLILTALPPVVGIFIFSLNYQYMSVIFTEAWGLRILGTAVLLQITGFLWIRKIVDIQV
jgi:tight adherence protein B